MCGAKEAEALRLVGLHGLAVLASEVDESVAADPDGTLAPVVACMQVEALAQGARLVLERLVAKTSSLNVRQLFAWLFKHLETQKLWDSPVVLDCVRCLARGKANRSVAVVALIGQIDAHGARALALVSAVVEQQEWDGPLVLVVQPLVLALHKAPQLDKEVSEVLAILCGGKSEQSEQLDALWLLVQQAQAAQEKDRRPLMQCVVAVAKVTFRAKTVKIVNFR